ncbi:hypothetical protein ACIQ4I_01325 [Rummeliibacillus sp. NPDC094406]|uniref:hypothetical protein n=1 Tax=Rummeliibacillus sp. NPDC094406 TaxID=3364511 RepID=UPI00381161F1
MKRFISYLMWVAIIGIGIYSGLRFRVYLGKEEEISYNDLPIMIFSFVFPIIIGILLRLPNFLIEKKGKKKWSFDWVKLIAIAFPVLYVALLPYLVYSSLGEELLFSKQVFLLGDTTITLTTVAGIVFGYVLLDSVKV